MKFRDFCWFYILHNYPIFIFTFGISWLYKSRNYVNLYICKLRNLQSARYKFANLQLWDWMQKFTRIKDHRLRKSLPSAFSTAVETRIYFCRFKNIKNRERECPVERGLWQDDHRLREEKQTISNNFEQFRTTLRSLWPALE